MIFRKLPAFTILYFISLHNWCVEANQTVINSEELRTAIAQAVPGNVIILGPKGWFTGEYVLNGNGQPSAHITIKVVDKDTKVIGSGTGTAFTILGNYWNIQSIPISNYEVGISVKGSQNSVLSVMIANISRGIEIDGEGTFLDGCVINKATFSNVVISANDTRVKGNVLQNDRRHSLIVEDTSCCGSVTGNTITGKVLMRGSNYTFNGNRVQGFMRISGCRNSFSGQVGPRPLVETKSCPNTFSSNVFL